MTAKTKPFDAADYLETEEDAAAYMTEALASGEAAVVARALGTIARARGMSRIARKTGLARESLYRALSAEGNPELTTVLRIIEAIGLRLSAEPASKAA
ncbi:MAG TPA: addiction module antidote protein [Stellaceae bacterium]|nr:addiction module antidote protein [Stellaceae bacterium]